LSLVRVRRSSVCGQTREFGIVCDKEQVADEIV